ncbi:polysaccharide pyruvyl transferase family protein [Jeotgalibacillus salarius]|uniref:Polysaccharide pyruvyl transferase n=1 Tax=Jeotgalibacillus salarius TaxID=546023 RepID=A0A4Y8LN12_9BACL|nr:polysaccharide pyruvyl transferase family protein [Jeotgalibacillus salarius]TFE03983.1 polysaccharide pyruvyl transferase [Jeotgalibacillus salarius]
MRVAIAGNYGHDNNGDEAILAGMLQSLEKYADICRKDITVFSNYPHKTIEEHKVKSAPLLVRKSNKLIASATTLLSHRKVLKDVDLLIIGGGGLLMDLYKRDAPAYASIAMIAKKMGCEVVVWGVGAGPITTSPGTLLIRQITKAASVITVRDEDSKKLLRRIGVEKSIDITADPAFGLEPAKMRDHSERIKKIAVTAVPYYSKQYWPVHDEEKYSAYISSFAKSLDLLMKEKNVEVTFYATKYPQDLQVVKDIQSNMINTSNLIEKNMKPDDLMKLSIEQDLIIGTRLHSLILAVRTGTPIIGVGYHKKVGSFAKLIGQQDYYVDIESLSENTLLEKVELMEKDWLKHQQEIEQTAHLFYSKAAEFPKMLKQQFGGKLND